MVVITLAGCWWNDHLQLKKPQSDIQLRDSTGYVVTTTTYKEHLAITNGVQEKSDCANHKAVNQATRPRKHVDNTGIGAIACARHGFFVPHSIVNFKKGEQWVCIICTEHYIDCWLDRRTWILHFRKLWSSLPNYRQPMILMQHHRSPWSMTWCVSMGFT